MVSEAGATMSEKYMSIGAPMTELPLAQPRGHSHTSHSHRATSAMAGGAKFHDSCYNSHSNHHGNGVSWVGLALAVLDGKIAGKADDENIFVTFLELSDRRWPDPDLFSLSCPATAQTKHNI